MSKAVRRAGEWHPGLIVSDGWHRGTQDSRKKRKEGQEAVRKAGHQEQQNKGSGLTAMVEPFLPEPPEQIELKYQKMFRTAPPSVKMAIACFSSTLIKPSGI